MKKIAVENIEDNMIVGRDICGSNGNVLISKGTTLSVALGRRLENWGIAYVYIEGEEEILHETTTVSESSEMLYKKLIEKFSKVLDNPLMKKIFDAVYDFRSINNN